MNYNQATGKTKDEIRTTFKIKESSLFCTTCGKKFGRKLTDVQTLLKHRDICRGPVPIREAK